MLNMNGKDMFSPEDAVAYRIHFTAMICTYGSVAWDEIEKYDCNRCNHTVQINDFLAPRPSCIKNDGALLDIFRFGVREEIRNELIRSFDVSENDFRPCRNKTGDIVYYQITPQHTMLPIANVNNWRSLTPCRKCGRVQYRDKDRKTAFDGNDIVFISKAALDDLHDLNCTYENFEMHIPEFIVSKRVYNFFATNYPRLLFDPVFLK